jgi:hypothetical protein
MHARIAIFDSMNMHVASLKIDIGPTQCTSLRGPQAVPENNQEQGRVPLAVAIAGSRLDQPLDFGLGQILARAQPGIRACGRPELSAFRWLAIGGPAPNLP